MKLERINFRNVAKTGLTDDDRYVLQTIYQSRLRTWALVFTVICAYLSLRTFPFFLNNDPAVLSGGVATVLLVGVAPATFFFWKYVWAYRRDLKCGYKYVVYEQVIGKRYFEHTGQCFLSLSDVNYMHHEVDAETYDRTMIGDRYPVYFTVYSRYPFTLRARVTMM